MKYSFSEITYRVFMFFFAPVALLCLALPGKDPLCRKRSKSTRLKQAPNQVRGSVLAFVPSAPGPQEHRANAYRCRNLLK